MRHLRNRTAAVVAMSIALPVALAYGVATENNSLLLAVAAVAVGDGFYCQWRRVWRHQWAASSAQLDADLAAQHDRLGHDWHQFENGDQVCRDNSCESVRLASGEILAVKWAYDRVR